MGYIRLSSAARDEKTIYSSLYHVKLSRKPHKKVQFGKSLTLAPVLQFLPFFTRDPFPKTQAFRRQVTKRFMTQAFRDNDLKQTL
ncbi:hypothetical protein TNIN_220681 [Trichonephila inaurata madagascariensis]|uniref:Uncharacterized protein n=1 Tax=Trichonephila inaurata madagascariensis TaxID=2747483 RepID=A0A8X6MJA3_9ARAC|nr:hypothetical protein TNIN_220681 [Trichonephila inaurata madagascariensis]